MAPAGAPMVMTTLEARVDVDDWHMLRDEYRIALETPEPGLVESFLVQMRNDADVWRIVTLWRDAEALAAMREAGTPRGVLAFRAAGAEPMLLVAEVAAHLRGEPG
jgi:heme-degrading monooxygenase HmoA